MILTFNGLIYHCIFLLKNPNDIHVLMMTIYQVWKAVAVVLVRPRKRVGRGLPAAAIRKHCKHLGKSFEILLRSLIRQNQPIFRFEICLYAYDQ